MLSLITLVSMVAMLAVVHGQGFQEANKALARQLDNQKVGLRIGSPCPERFSTTGVVLCVGDQLGRCTDGVVSGPIFNCNTGLTCQVLPLVRSPGVSVTCSTDADKNARIGDGGKTPVAVSSAINPKNAPIVNKNGSPNSDLPSNQNKNTGTSAVKNGGGKSANTGDIRQANKSLAKELDGQKSGLSIGSPCPSQFNRDGAVLCAGNQIARCNGGVVSGPLQNCALTLNCQVLPLVNSPGVSVTCTTDADKNARING